MDSGSEDTWEFIYHHEDDFDYEDFEDDYEAFEDDDEEIDDGDYFEDGFHRFHRFEDEDDDEDFVQFEVDDEDIGNDNRHLWMIQIIKVPSWLIDSDSL